VGVALKRERGGARGGAFHVVLLAGGSGTRFWPMSRRARPKQLLPLAGARSLLRETWDRALSLAPVARIWVVAPKALSAAIRRELPRLRADRLILEPSPRDTAPAVALACATVAPEDPDATVGIFPTDHLVRDVGAFARAVAAAREEAASGSLVCLGVRPDRPATGFGYLKLRSRPARGGRARALAVARFVEKPDAARARRFVSSGRYLWNGGMFVWKASAFLAAADRVAPEVAAAARAVSAGRIAAWSAAPKISVDYAVMEKAERVAVVPLDAGWDDVGSWDAAARLKDGRPRDLLAIDSPGSVVFGRGRLVAVLGLPGIVVVDTDDALLVAARSASEDLKSLVAALRESGRDDLL